MDSHHDRLNLSPILDSYDAYGCRVNAINVDELFRRYELAGFLYPAKMKLLAPFWPLIRENWRRSLRGGELIHYVISAELPDEKWAAISSWRNTYVGWNTQHLVGIGGPAATRAVMLSAQAVRIRDGLDGSHQSWFRRSNRFANKVFGSIGQTLSSSIGWVGDYSYFAVPLSTVRLLSDKVHVREAKDADLATIRRLTDSARSVVYSSAEGLEDGDLCLDAVDELYRKVGLRRYRRTLLFEMPGHDQIVGVAFVYRGPLGLNFSFLENRCDLIVDPSLEPPARSEVLSGLVAAAAEHYADFAPGIIPVLVDTAHGDDIRALKGQYIRDYAQSVWLRRGFESWYRHVEQIYDRTLRGEGRRGLASKKPLETEEAQ